MTAAAANARSVSLLLRRRFQPDPEKGRLVPRVCLLLGGRLPPYPPAGGRVVLRPPPLPDVPRNRLRSSSVHFAQSRSCQGIPSSSPCAASFHHQRRAASVQERARQ